MGKRLLWGFAPYPDREPLYMGLRPMPHLGIFFGKKIPKNPKKPNCIGFKPSNTDSEQGCRRQPCFMCSANGAFSFSAKILKLKVRSFKEYTAKRNKARLSFQPCFRYLSGRRSLFYKQTSIVSENHAKANSSNLLGLEHSLCLSARGHNRGGEVRFLREEGRNAPASPFGCR